MRLNAFGGLRTQFTHWEKSERVLDFLFPTEWLLMFLDSPTVKIKLKCSFVHAVCEHVDIYHYGSDK